MKHRIEVSKLEARMLEHAGKPVECFDGEDGYGWRYYAEESDVIEMHHWALVGLDKAMRS